MTMLDAKLIKKTVNLLDVIPKIRINPCERGFEAIELPAQCRSNGVNNLQLVIPELLYGLPRKNQRSSVSRPQIVDYVSTFGMARQAQKHVCVQPNSGFL